LSVWQCHNDSLLDERSVAAQLCCIVCQLGGGWHADRLWLKECDRGPCGRAQAGCMIHQGTGTCKGFYVNGDHLTIYTAPLGYMYENLPSRQIAPIVKNQAFRRAGVMMIRWAPYRPAIRYPGGHCSVRNSWAPQLVMSDEGHPTEVVTPALS
jgi:hypothetical protein